MTSDDGDTVLSDRGCGAGAGYDVAANVGVRAGDGFRCQKQERADAEVGWIEDVAAIEAQRVFGTDGKGGAQRVGPEGR